MKNLKKLGQTATEYLIILAVVIVIALIVVGVMGGIPGVGSRGKGGVEEAYWTTAPVGLGTVGISATSGESLVIKNNQNDVITVTSVTFNGVEMLPGAPDAITVAAGESRTVASGNVIGDGETTTCPAGTSFSFPVVIDYTMQTSGASYTQQGRNIAGTCAN
jgi:hypothetical protein